MEEIRESIIDMFETRIQYGCFDTYTDGTNIILLTNPEGQKYLVKFDEKWYRVILDWDGYCVENADITPIDKDYPEEYLEQEYFSKGFDWNKYGEMEELN